MRKLKIILTTIISLGMSLYVIGVSLMVTGLKIFPCVTSPTVPDYLIQWKSNVCGLAPSFGLIQKFTLTGNMLAIVFLVILPIVITFFVVKLLFFKKK